MADIVVNGFDVTTLSDDELYERLKFMGVEIGPVVDSTREVYERKLHRLMNNDDDNDVVKESTAECREATPVASVNHAGILKSTLDLPRMRTARRSVTITTLKSAPQTPEVQSQEETPYESPSYFVLPTPRHPLHTGKTSANTSAEFPISSMHSTSFDSMTCREAVFNNNFDGQKADSSAAPLQKTNPLFITVFEVFIISFLVIVGYVFYQEVVSFTQAEKEFLESNAQAARDM